MSKDALESYRPADRGRRRRQQERSGETRARVLDAAVACVAEEGLRTTNLARIAARAGLTTGAIQHQFGDKASVLAAVVERSFAALAAELARIPTEGLPLRERLARFVQALWARYTGDESRASLEILIQMRGDPAFGERSLPTLTRIRSLIDRLWMGVFWDADVPRQRHVAAQRLLFTTLNGLAFEKILIGDVPDPRRDLDGLVEHLVRDLGGGSREGRS